jgi:ATP synthase protein I
MQNIKVERPQQHSQSLQDEQDDQVVEVWTKERAAAWRAHNPPVSLWWIVRCQIVIAGLLVLVVWLVSSSQAVLHSTMYGALCVIIPSALYAHGLRQRAGVDNRHRLGLFVIWELAKVMLSITMLYLAPKLLNEINWLALLASFVVTIKLYWLALAWSTVQNTLRMIRK